MIYLITLNDHDYDQHDGFVVVAKSKKEAINLVKDITANWSSGYKIQKINTESKSKIILTSFNAG